LSQVQLAERALRDQVWIHRIEAGKVLPRIDDVEVLAAALEMSPAMLLYGPPPPPAPERRRAA
jgi:predicted transcriptional regulator